MPIAEKIGSGRPVICVHGTPGDRQTWYRIAQHRTDGYALWLMELVDHGDMPDSMEGLVAYERDVETAIRAAEQPVVLCGLSVGAFVAARLASRVPDRIERIVVCGGLAELTREERELRVGVIRELRSGQTPAALFAPFLDAFVPPNERDAETERITARSIDTQTAARFARTIERVLEIGTGEMRVAPYETPTTLLHARNDAMVPLAHGEELASLGKNAKLVVLEAGSHMLPLSHVSEVARHLFA